MARDSLAPPRATFWAGDNPWPALWTGLGLVAASWVSSRVSPDALLPLRVSLLFIGLVAAGFAVAVRFRAGGWDWDERLTTAGVIALASVAAVVANFALKEEWDSAALLLRVLTGVGLAGAGVLLLPQGWRRLVVSLLVLFHFGGIVTAVTTVAPPNAAPPWVTSWLWSYVYRPYLDFMYLTNAYHFYSPEPGPPSLLWFYVEYEDGSIRELKIPNREDFPTRLAYQRRLALTESTAQTQPVPQTRLEELIHKRLAAGVAHNPPIPLHPDLPVTMQYAEPMLPSKTMLSAYARHVARNYPHQNDPGVSVKQVKVYRLIHRIMSAPELALGIDPLDPITYWPFYAGTYDREGNLTNPEDPFLYWMMPIFKVEKNPGAFRSAFPSKGTYKPDDFETKNYLEIHAGVK